MHRHHTHGVAAHAARFDVVFAVAVGLNTLYIVVEAGFGLWIGSLALLADAGHNLSDVLGLLMAWGAHALIRLRPTQRRTYGWRSTTIFAALGNGLLLVGAVGAVTYEAIHRLFEPPPVPGLLMLGVALVGVVINSVTAYFLLRGSEADLNIRSAFLHMAADAAISAAVVGTGLVIYLFQTYWLDPVVSLLVGAVILYTTWEVLTEAVNLALHAVPSDVDLEEVRKFLLGLPGVTDVHDLHVWALSTTEKALTAHLIMPEPPEDRNFAGWVAHQLHDRFGIHHSTIQIDPASCGLVCHPADYVHSHAAVQEQEQ